MCTIATLTFLFKKDYFTSNILNNQNNAIWELVYLLSHGLITLHALISHSYRHYGHTEIYTNKHKNNFKTSSRLYTIGMLNHYSETIYKD